jgi:crossover junction endodeoxyribonuclease RusA
MNEIKPIKYALPKIAGTVTSIKYPWPPKELSPNSRVHWSKKSEAAKKVKRDAYYLTREANPLVSELPTLSIVFHPPTAAKNDIDNCLARCKSLIDGISIALGIDDSKFKYTIQMGEKVDGGCVAVDIN